MFLIASEGVLREFSSNFFILFLGWYYSPFAAFFALSSPCIDCVLQNRRSLKQNQIRVRSRQLGYTESNQVLEYKFFLPGKKDTDTLIVEKGEKNIFKQPKKKKKKKKHLKQKSYRLYSCSLVQASIHANVQIVHNIKSGFFS